MERRYGYVTTRQCLWPDLKPEFSNNNAVVSSKNLSTPVKPVVLKDIPTSTKKDVINLLSLRVL